MMDNRPNNPARPVPSALVNDLMDDWREHGREAINRVRTWTPQRYIHLVAALAPPGTSEQNRMSAMSDEELRAAFVTSVRKSHAAGLLPGWTPPADEADPCVRTDDV